MPHTKKKRARENNSDRLSKGKSIARAKALLKARRAEECTFDSVARQEFLTGFHKRKVERRNAAIEKVKAEQRTQQLSMRADLRAQRKAELAQRLAAHRAELGLDSDDGELEQEAEEWHGFDGEQDNDAKGAKRLGLWEVNEYEDDEKLVSVVVEAM